MVEPFNLRLHQPTLPYFHHFKLAISRFTRSMVRGHISLSYRQSLVEHQMSWYLRALTFSFEANQGVNSMLPLCRHQIFKIILRSFFTTFFVFLIFFTTGPLRGMLSLALQVGR